MNCTSCGRYIEEPAAGLALRCPHCGAPVRRGRGGAATSSSRLSRRLAAFAVFSLAAILFFVSGSRRIKLSMHARDVLVQVDAIRQAEQAYHAEWGAYVPALPTPADVPEGETVPFEGPGLSSFQQLGWAPATTRCRFRVHALAPRGASSADDFEVTADCDHDGDGQRARYAATRQEKARRTSVAGEY